jgi:hypothetical protein
LDSSFSFLLCVKTDEEEEEDTPPPETDTHVGTTNDGAVFEANPSLVYPVPLSTTIAGRL